MSNFYQNVILGKINVDKIYDSDKVLAFHHTKPSYIKHVVIIPKKNIKDLVSLDEKDNDILIEMMEVAKDIAATFDMNEGIRVVTNMGRFQDSSHLHFHVIQGEKLNLAR